VALDTNVLAYAEGVNDASMKEAALDLLQKLPQDAIVLPVQTLGELFNVLVRKAGRSPANARTAILSWRDAFPLIDTSAGAMLAATDLATDHQLSIWDAVILAAAAEGRCRLLLSENLQEGFTWSGVTVTNPFLASRHALLESLLENTART
jgi:predicted nucleic acid-binding protein